MKEAYDRHVAALRECCRRQCTPRIDRKELNVNREFG